MADEQVIAPFAETVAKRAKVDVQDVEAVLESIDVREASGTHRAESLVVRRVYFSGTKAGKDVANEDFAFEWNDLGTGLWGILSDGLNLIGKTTIMEVILWALRGRSRGLKSEVRAWIQSVEVAFSIGIDQYRVTFTDVTEGAQGSLIHEGPGAARTLAVFSGDEQFERVMDNLMTERFALPPIQNLSGEDDGGPQESTHRWPAYARSLFIEGSHPAILGDIAVGGLWWRMLQLFVGLPYADTLMAIRHALAFDKAGKGSGRHSQFANEDIVRLQKALASEEGKLRAMGSKTTNLREVDELTLANAKLAKEIAGVQARQATAERTAEQAKAEWDLARAELRRLKEGAGTRKIFSGLKPVCCPRCSNPFPEDRVAHEDSGRCSVCDRTGLVDDPDGYNERLAAAVEREADLKRLHRAASQEAANLGESALQKERDRKAIMERLAYLETLAETLSARRRQENVIERLKGALDEVKRSVTPTKEDAPEAVQTFSALQKRWQRRVCKRPAQDNCGSSSARLLTLAAALDFGALRRSS
ncbi:ATP-binding protein [Caenispirillum bisanense]|uniref:AAA family ATPase n=1 Tax=Caenispirillum bisanense TaxID=414052 RepID=UPI0031E18E2F